MTAQYTAFLTRSASLCFSAPAGASRTCCSASWAACRARVGLLACRRISSPMDGLRLFTAGRERGQPGPAPGGLQRGQGAC
ncbi:hypothetical protein DR999_PMT22228 [Platysternon megacephalum]|uniref:Uncharacterized protein n=1 Tax=Platysternon megacephalum TaxID=55544 RepID=A0A4D9DM34_9SAUR|nr:hypothetical protein DR999_PMT22228 [Platysternon megacephalum]